MNVFFETISGSFCIELGYFDTVLEIKEKIEKYQNIPVSKQTLFFNGKVLLQDDLDAKILHNCRLHILCTNHNHSSDEVLTQTEQSSPVPSNSIGDIIYGQDLPLTTEHFSNIQAFWPATTEETSNVRDSPVRNNDQVLQTEKSTLSNSTEQIINDQDPATVQELQTEQSPLSNSVKKIINIPDSAVKMRSNKRYPKRTKVASNNNNNNSLALQMEQSPPLKSAKQLINVQDSPVKVVRRNKKSKVLETEKSPPSNSVKEIINGHQDAPRTPVKVVRRNKKNDQVLETEKSPPSNSNKRDH